MGKKLVIVESPAKARTIGRFLGDDFELTASVGHIRDLPASTLGVDVNDDFKPRYITMRGKHKVVQELKKLAKAADQVFIATDPDREGEAIAWHIANILKIDPNSKSRVTFNEITEKAVKEAIENPRCIDMDLVNAQQARRILDRLVGYEISPVLWQKIKAGLSAGRVQSVATRMIVDREEEIEAFVPEEYWILNVLLEKANQSRFKARLQGLRQGVNQVKALKVPDRKAMDEILAKLERAEFSVAEIKSGKRKRNPYAPFTTSTLQQEAARRLNFSSRKTMSVAQQLYEGVDLPGVGATALVTYIRTDSVRISNEALAQARRLIESQFGEAYLPAKPRLYKNKSAAQDAHEAIRPSHFNQMPEKVKDSLTLDQYRLYKLIWDRFLASQMESANLNTLRVDVEAAGYIFRANGEQLVFPGFLKIYGDRRDNKSADKAGGDKGEADELNEIPDLKKGEVLECKEKKPEQKFTQPPARYSEASLIKAMEEEGIGRPSTYAPTISTILDRNYAEKNQRQLVPTDLGRLVTDLLRNNFDDYINKQFTAVMENRLDEVESGDVNWIDLMKHFYPDFHKTVQKAEKEIEEQKIKPQPTGEKCPKCGADLFIKDGRYGKFIACSAFPDCSYTASIVESTGQHCPKCGSPVVGRKSRRGSTFYTCDKSKDENCDFISWDLPLDDKKCETCGSYMVQKNYRGRSFERCSNKDCPTNENKNKKKGTSKTKGKAKKTPSAKKDKSQNEAAKKTGENSGG